MKPDYIRKKLNVKYGYHKDQAPQGTLNAFLKIEQKDDKPKQMLTLQKVTENVRQVEETKDYLSQSTATSTIADVGRPLPQANNLQRKQVPVELAVPKLIESDTKSISLDILLRVWISQLVENSIECSPSFVEVKFIGRGADGFDIIDDGVGYTHSQLSLICKCLPDRERNEIYKEKSIGYRGEALQSLCKASHL